MTTGLAYRYRCSRGDQRALMLRSDNCAAFQRKAPKESKCYGCPGPVELAEAIPVHVDPASKSNPHKPPTVAAGSEEKERIKSQPEPVAANPREELIQAVRRLGQAREERHQAALAAGRPSIRSMLEVGQLLVILVRLIGSSEGNQ